MNVNGDGGDDRRDAQDDERKGADEENDRDKMETEKRMATMMMPNDDQNGGEAGVATMNVFKMNTTAMATINVIVMVPEMTANMMRARATRTTTKAMATEQGNPTPT